MFVLTVDQVGSREAADAVPHLERARGIEAAVLRFDRTAGDEAQAVFDAADPAIECLLALASSGEWHCGLGQGTIEPPWPKTAREGRGSAYINARAAVEDAKRPGAHHVGFTADSDLGAGVRSGLRAIVTMWSKRGAKAREAYDLAVTGMTQADMARRLGISQQAVSGRLSASMYRETEDLRREMIRWAQHLDSSDGLARTAGSS